MKKDTLVILAVIIAAATAVGCIIDPPEPNPVNQAPSIIAPPIKIAVMSDKTGSANYTRTEQPKPDDLAVLIELVTAAGGELAVGLVADDSNRPLARLRIAAPPLEPVKPQRHGNAFEVAERVSEYEEKYAAYRKAIENHRADSEREVERFKEQIAGVLAGKPSFNRSDVWGAIARADLFLAEDHSVWGLPPEKFLILVSDGQHNVDSPAVQVTSGAAVVLVNGAGRVGDLATLKPQTFENVQAAFQHVRAIRKRN
jgi:hypothetical protein